MARTGETRFTGAGDIDVAYQVVGLHHDRDLIFVPAWVSNIEVMWELPEFAAFLERRRAHDTDPGAVTPVVARMGVRHPN